MADKFTVLFKLNEKDKRQLINKYSPRLNPNTEKQKQTSNTDTLKQNQTIYLDIEKYEKVLNEDTNEFVTKKKKGKNKKAAIGAILSLPVIAVACFAIYTSLNSSLNRQTISTSTDLQNNNINTDQTKPIVVDYKIYYPGETIKTEFYIQRKGLFYGIEFLIKYDHEVFTLNEESIEFHRLCEKNKISPITYTKDGAVISVESDVEGYVYEFEDLQLFLTCEFQVRNDFDYNIKKGFNNHFNLYTISVYDSDYNSITEPNEVCSLLSKDVVTIRYKY